MKPVSQDYGVSSVSAVKTKIRRVRKTKLTCKKAKVLKGPTELSRQLRRPVLVLQPSDSCCEEKTQKKGEVYLIMGHNRDAKLVPSFIMPWGKRSKPFKRAVRMFKKLNCSDPKLVSDSVIGDAFGSNGSATGSTAGTSGRRKRGKTKGRRKKTDSSPVPPNGASKLAMAVA